MKRKNAFEQLEDKLNIATTVIEEFVEEETLPTPTEIELPVETIDEVFTLSTLKQDFVLVRQNLLSLIVKGQRLLDSSCTLDMTELKASQIEAISNLTSTIANTSNMIIDMYKKISEIESKKINKFSGDQVVQSVNTGTVNNIVFQGTTHDLLKMIHETQQN